MTATAIAISILCQIFLVLGNLMLKRGMTATAIEPLPRARVAVWLGGGIAVLSLWFFLWLGLLSEWDVSQLYPFEGLSPVLLMLAAWLWLGERVPPRAWLGVVLIGAGVAFLAKP